MIGLHVAEINSEIMGKPLPAVEYKIEIFQNIDKLRKVFEYNPLIIK